jgi:hypothetical protein
MRARKLASATIVLAVVLWSAPSHATSLAGQLIALPHQASSTPNAASFDTFTPQLVALAARGVDFPQASTTPGVVYRYNPDLGMFERSPDLGPVLLERANTVGANVFDVSGTYLFANLKNQDGHAIGDGKERLFARFNTFGSIDQGTQSFSKFSLYENVFSVSGTYGITDRWDVNALLPVIFTSLHANSTVSLDQTVNTGVDDEKLNIGDILLRTKYRFWDADPADMAVGFVLRLPSGNKANFQGLGDTTLTPLFIASRTFGPVSTYINLGIEVDAAEVARTQARYGLGVAYQVIDQLALLVDLLGTSGFTSTTVNTNVNLGPSFPLSAQGIHNGLQSALNQNIAVTRNGSTATLGLELAREDLLDVAAGIKFSLPGGVIGFMSAIIPITEQGITATVIPTAGVSYSF